MDSLGWFPLLDVIVKNNSEEKVALTSLDFEVTNVAFGPSLRNAKCKRIAPTWYYNLLLVGTEKIGEVRRVAVAQEVDPKDVDRFVIAIGWDSGRLERTPRPASVTFEFNLTLHSDEGSTRLGTKKVTVTTTPCRFTQPAPLTEVARPSSP